MARAARYGVGGIPEVIIEGTEEYIGASPCAQMIPEYEEGIYNSLNAFSYLSPIEITGGMEIVGNTATITANIELVDDVTLPALQATLFLAENNITWCCGYGNVDHWDEVTRMVRSTPITPTYGGGPVQVVQNVNIAAFNAAELHAYAIVEAVGGTQQVYQATDFVPVDYFFAQAFNSRIDSAPDGNATITFDGFVQNLGSEADVVDLSISGFGWPADFQIEGDATWYTATSLPLAVGEQKNVTVRVQTDSDLRIGEGSLVGTGQAQGQVQTSTFKIFNASPAILMVDDDGAGTYEDTFTNAFTAAGYLFEEFATGSGSGPSAVEMNGFDAVVWQTAYGTATLTAAEVQELQTYLDNGGGLFLNSMDFLTSQAGGTEFTEDYLGLSGWVNNAKADLADGVSGDPITNGMDFAVSWPVPNANRADHLLMGGATGILTDEDTQFVACRYQLPGGNRTVLNTIPLDSYVIGSEPSTRQTLVTKTLDWILGEDDPAAIDETGATNLGLLGASPNPFTPATELSFQLSETDAQEPVTLLLVDAGGRQVRSLVAGRLEAGAHRITWNGRDDADREVAGGVYFGKLETAQGVSLAKIVKVK